MIKKKFGHGSSRLQKAKHADWTYFQIVNNTGNTVRFIVFFKNVNTVDGSDSVAWIDLTLDDGEVSQKFHPLLDPFVQVVIETSPPLELPALQVATGYTYNITEDFQLVQVSGPSGDGVTLDNTTIGPAMIDVLKDGRTALSTFTDSSDDYVFTFHPTIWILATDTLDGDVDFLSDANTEISFLGIHSANIVATSTEGGYSLNLTDIVS